MPSHTPVSESGSGSSKSSATTTCGIWPNRRVRLFGGADLRRACIRSSCASSPPNGETSRISMDSRSNWVRTRYKPGTSPCFTRDSQRSRFRVCGWPVTPARSCRRLRSIVGCHCARVESVRWCASWQCSFHDRRSDRVRPAPFRSPSPPLSSTTLSFDFS